MVIGFIYNMALLVSCCVLYSLVPHQWIDKQQSKRLVTSQVLSGILFGVLGITGIFSAQSFSEGALCDPSTIVLCLAGVVSGPVAAAAAAVLCIASRLWLGGLGVLIAVCVIVEAAVFGSIYFYFRLRDKRLNGFLPLWGLGVLVHVIMLALMYVLPGGISSDVLRQLSFPVMLLFPVGVMVSCLIFIKINEKRIIESALRASEKNYHDLVEVGSLIIIRWNPDGIITYANDCALKLFGFSWREFIGQSLHKLLFPEHAAKVDIKQNIVMRMQEHPDVRMTHEQEHMRSDGTKIWVEWTGRAICDSSGAVIEVLSIGIDCTERKRMQEEFWQSQEQNLRIVETANEGIWSLDRSLCTTFMNLKNCALLGYDADDILGRCIEDFLFEEDIAQHAEQMAYCMQGESTMYEQRFACRDGSTLWALVSATPVMDAQGGFDGLFFMVNDISAQKQLQYDLQESEEKYHMLFEYMSQGVFYQSADGTLTDVNPEALNMFGLRRDQFLGRTSYASEWKVIDEDGSLLPAEEHPSMRALKTGKPVHNCILGIFNYRLDDYVWLNVSAVPRFAPGETVPCEVFVTLHDISASRKIQEDLLAREKQIQILLEEAQQARRSLLSILEDDREINESLQQSEERYRSVVETAIDAIITVDSVGNIVLWNQAASKIFGYESNDICGAPFSILFSNDVEDQDVRSLLEAVQSGVLPTPLTVNEVVALKKNNEQFPIEIAFGIVTQDQDRHITAIIRDITERKLMEQESLRSAQLVSIGELAAGVAHEINNPIMGVINYAQILLNSTLEQGGDGNIPIRIIKEGERIASIVSNLLNLARPDAGERVAVSVREVFEPACQLMQKLLQKSDVAIDAQFSDYQPRVLVFPQKIQQVFINLISNALYALDVRFPGPHEQKRLDVRVEEHADGNEKFIRVVFHDQGCGIPPEDLSRICNPFFSTKPMGKGTGLGLSICYKIMQEHGGRLSFESKLGQHTRVLVDLPEAP